MIGFLYNAKKRGRSIYYIETTTNPPPAAPAAATMLRSIVPIVALLGVCRAALDSEELVCRYETYDIQDGQSGKATCSGKVYNL